MGTVSININMFIVIILLILHIAHLYEEPTLPEPMYEQVLPTCTGKPIQVVNIKPNFHASVIMNSDQTNSASSIKMMECPAYQVIS